MAPKDVSSIVSTYEKVRKLPRPPKKPPGKKPSLGGALIACLQKSNFHDHEQDYFPVGIVQQLITPEAVEEELKKCHKEICALDDDEWKAHYRYLYQFKDTLVSWIADHAYRTFATAVTSNFSALHLLSFMTEFQEKGFTDKDLHILEPNHSIYEVIDNGAEAHSFCKWKWSFLAPIFTSRVYDYDLPNGYIFPFDKDESESKSGAFGTVSKVRIHPDHHEYSNMQFVSVPDSLK